MAELTQAQVRSPTRFLATSAVLSAGALTLLFAHALAAYWHFYHLDSGGTGLVLMLFVLPVSFVVSINAVFFLARTLVRRGMRMGAALALAALATAGVFALMLSLEIWRTTDLRSGEGAGAGDLAPYFLHHFR